MNYPTPSNYFDNINQNTQSQMLLSPPVSPGSSINAFNYPSNSNSTTSLSSIGSNNVQHNAAWLFDSWGDLPSDSVPVNPPPSNLVAAPPQHHYQKPDSGRRGYREKLVYGRSDAGSSSELTPRQIRHQLIYGTIDTPPIQKRTTSYNFPSAPAPMPYPTHMPATTWDPERTHLSAEPYNPALMNSNMWRS